MTVVGHLQQPGQEDTLRILCVNTGLPHTENCLVIVMSWPGDSPAGCLRASLVSSRHMTHIYTSIVQYSTVQHSADKCILSQVDTGCSAG